MQARVSERVKHAGLLTDTRCASPFAVVRECDAHGRQVAFVEEQGAVWGAPWAS